MWWGNEEWVWWCGLLWSTKDFVEGGNILHIGGMVCYDVVPDNLHTSWLAGVGLLLSPSASCVCVYKCVAKAC